MSESEEKDLREKASLFSGLPQRVIIVCFEMGIPYFKVRRGTRLRTQGPWVSSRLALVLGKGAREREDPRKWDFTHPCNQWMQCGLVCGCQSSKASGEPRPRACLSFSAKSKGGEPPEVGL